MSAEMAACTMAVDFGFGLDLDVRAAKLRRASQRAKSNTLKREEYERNRGSWKYAPRDTGIRGACRAASRARLALGVVESGADLPNVCRAENTKFSRQRKTFASVSPMLNTTASPTMRCKPEPMESHERAHWEKEALDALEAMAWEATKLDELQLPEPAEAPSTGVSDAECADDIADEEEEESEREPEKPEEEMASLKYWSDGCAEAPEEEPQRQYSRVEAFAEAEPLVAEEAVDEEEHKRAQQVAEQGAVYSGVVWVPMQFSGCQSGMEFRDQKAADAAKRESVLRQIVSTLQDQVAEANQAAMEAAERAKRAELQAAEAQSTRVREEAPEMRRSEQEKEARAAHEAQLAADAQAKAQALKQAKALEQARAKQVRKDAERERRRQQEAEAARAQAAREAAAAKEREQAQAREVQRRAREAAKAAAEADAAAIRARAHQEAEALKEELRLAKARAEAELEQMQQKTVDSPASPQAEDLEAGWEVVGHGPSEAEEEGWDMA